MKKIVIIGNSAAAVAAAEAIREKDRDSLVCMVSREQFLAYRRPRILDFLEAKIREKELIFRDLDFYKDNRIELLLGSEVCQISPRQKKIIFKNKDFREFDELVIATGLKVALPSVKGIQKEGVVGLEGLEEVKFLLENLALAHTVVVVGDDAVAFEMVRIIASKKIEVKLLCAKENSQGAALPEGAEIIAGNPLIEILGESEVRAARLSNHKVIGVSLVVFTGPRLPRIDFLRDSGVEVNRGILVDASMRTNVPFIFAVGDVAECQNGDNPAGWDAAAEQGRFLGRLF